MIKLVVLLCLLVTPAWGRSILVMGDSIGIGIAEFNKNPDQISIAQTNSGLYPSVFGDWVERAREINTAAYTITLISIGSNDLYKYSDPKDYANRTRTLAAQLKSSKTVWYGPPCMFLSWSKNDHAKKVDALFREILAEFPNIRYVSVYERTLTDGKCIRGPNRTSDGIHFTPYGYQLLWKEGVQ